MPLSANNLTLDLPADLTPKTVTQTLPGPVTNIESEVDLWTQINQSLSNNLGSTVQLTEDQFSRLLTQLAISGLNLPLPSKE
jgi:hypothetical protein